MKRAIVGLFLLLTTSANAANVRFYESNKNKDWEIFGVVKSDKGIPYDRCLMQRSYKDGSYIQLIKDLSNNQTHMLIANAEWNLTVTPENKPDGKSRIFFIRNSEIADGSSNFFIIGKKEIIFPDLNEEFLRNWIEYKAVLVIMPPEYNFVKFTLDNTTNALMELVDCIKTYNKLPQKKQTPILPNAVERKA